MSIKKLSPQPLKIGFDLDGVILYNPARVVRPFIALAKKLVYGSHPPTKFRIPQSQGEKALLSLLHKSSLFIAPGFTDIKRLAQTGKIEAYLITGRYNFLKQDFEKWLDKMQAGTIFRKIHLNERNEQPHLYKEALIKKYHLDVFIDDNWDIIQHLHQGFSKKTHATLPIWVYNLFDKKIPYPHKYNGLKPVMAYIEKTLLSKHS
jgi:hypothetical protein